MHPHASHRDRTPRGPVPQSPNHNIAPPKRLLPLNLTSPSTLRFNSFVPDAQMLFHVLGICDQLMLTTTQFLRSSHSSTSLSSGTSPSSATSFTTSPPATTLTAFSFNGTVTSSLKAFKNTNRIGPQLCGSLFSTPQQTGSARAFWSSVFAGATRVNAAGETAPFTSILNLFGFENSQTNWFQYTCIVMHNYSKYFNGSVPLSSILPTELGAVAVRGAPSINEATRSFLYPTDAEIEPLTSSRFNPRRQIPFAMSVTFQHCEYDGLGEETLDHRD
ncbi:unnamed protein product [Brassica oleracea]